MDKKNNKFIDLIFVLIIISAVIVFVRYIIFFDFIIYNSESSIPETPKDQINETIKIGL